MPDILDVPGTKLKMSVTITPHFPKVKSGARLNFEVVNALSVPVLLKATYTNRFIKLIIKAERKFVLITPRRYHLNDIRGAV